MVKVYYSFNDGEPHEFGGEDMIEDGDFVIRLSTEMDVSYIEFKPDDKQRFTIWTEKVKPIEVDFYAIWAMEGFYVGHTSIPYDLKIGDYVKDLGGNTYEIEEITKDVIYEHPIYKMQLCTKEQ